MEENNKKHEKGTLGWLRQQAKKDGFDDLSKWNKWKTSNRNIRNKICNHCNKHSTKIYAYREINNDGQFTGKWVCKICYNYRLIYGRYKNDYKSPGWFNEILEKYGKEFADWAIKNKDKVPGHFLIAGCKNDKEYRDKKARDAGFKNRQDREDYNARLLGYEDEAARYGWNVRKTKEYQDEMKKRREFRKTKEYIDSIARENGFKDDNHRRNVQRWNNEGIIPVERNEECESHIGCIIGEDRIGKHILSLIFESVDKKKFNNPGYEFVCKDPKQEFLDRYPQFKLERHKEYKIDVKTAHFLDEYWKYRIDYNNIPDYFLPIGLGTDDNTPQYIMFIHKDNIIRERKFWRRVGITIGKKYMTEFSRYDLKYELEEFKRVGDSNV